MKHTPSFPSAALTANFRHRNLLLIITWTLCEWGTPH